jgi:[CysO sulfur-carrier protein]-S-L-cysteine hydrolase
LSKKEFVLLPEQIRQQMLDHVDRNLPNEACGFLGGNQRVVKSIVPVMNILHSPFRYKMDPQEQLDAMLGFEEKNLEIVGIFHSHPNGPDIPSMTDLAEAFYPEAIYFIWSRLGMTWACRAFLLRDGTSIEVDIGSKMRET